METPQDVLSALAAPCESHGWRILQLLRGTWVLCGRRVLMFPVLWAGMKPDATSLNMWKACLRWIRCRLDMINSCGWVD